MRSIYAFIVILLIIGIILALPFVQTKIGKYATDSLNKKYKTSINVEQVSLTIFGGLKLKKISVLDHHNDTLIYANRIKTNILDYNKLLKGNLIFGDISADGLYFNMKTYKKEKVSNLDKFINAFDTGKPPSKEQFLMTATKVEIKNGHYSLVDENRAVPVDVDFTNINLASTALHILGPDVSTTINKLSFNDHRGIYIADLNTKFSYTKKQIKLENLNLLTKQSRLKGQLVLNYDIQDFSNFTDKVEFDMDIEKASIGTNDINCFYNELGKDHYFKLSGKIKGPLNNLVFSKLKLKNLRNSEIRGTINFKNLFPKNGKEFYMNAKFGKLTTSYNDLIAILPRVLGKRLPVVLKKLGEINLVGKSKVTTNSLDAIFTMKTQIGFMKSNLVINKMNEPDFATYKGNIVLNKFDFGNLLDRTDVEKVSLNLNVDGKGFTEKALNTSILGTIDELYFNSYNYSKLELNGNFKSGLYNAKIKSADPNLKMDFDGLVSLSAKKNNYNFHINVGSADLKKLHFKNDSTSKFTGDIVADLSGNSIDNLSGDIDIKNTSYQNAKSTYFFDDLKIKSSFDSNSVRTILVNSRDVVNGEIIGKYNFNQLQKLVTNSLGSLYANYKPLKVKKGQFLQFNFVIFNKIIEIFYPEISIAGNTVAKGNISSDDQDFKFNFNSPKITTTGNTFDNIRLKIDNRNPLYTAFIEMDSIKTKYYKIRDFSLINIAAKDTLYFRTEFKGGTKGKDFFNLNLYHTINKDNKNVVGIKKSEVKVKDYLWFLNENETNQNQIVFDKSLTNFNFDNLRLTHDDQEIFFNGEIKGSSYKNLELKFKNVDLNQITPSDPKFVFSGNLNANVNYKQNQTLFQPTASIEIEKLNLNSVKMGRLIFDISGDESLKKFKVASTIENADHKSLSVAGNFEILDKSTILNLQLNLEKFNLGFLAPLGSDVVSKIRGFASGNGTIEGNLNKPDINGRLYLDKAGLKIPYLNVDYSFAEKSIVDLTDDKFLFKNIPITDVKFATNGTLNGIIEHRNFADWKLDLAVNSKRLIALDTKDADDAAYYGQAFIDGVAKIKGRTNALLISIDAKSEKGTTLKIPINESESAADNQFLHFLNSKEKFNIKNGIVASSRNYNGLELAFDFDITPDAEVEVILDRNTGHGMKGKGNGTLLFKINTLGKFNMYGDFQALEGTYNFKYGGLIDKKFNVKKGGYISWEGNPLKATLNLEAVYKTSANPSVLLENSSNNRAIDVNVIIGIKGDLANPEPDFNFEFPTVTTIMKTALDYKLTEKEVRQTQALYLLSTGGFLSQEGFNQADIYQSAFDTASSLLSSLIKTKGEKLQVGFDIIGADRTAGRETDGRFVTSISSKINERVTFNGKLGVPFGGISQTAVVGDAEILYRVNQDGTMNLRFFNRENEISYIGQGIGYTQGIGVSYEVDFDNFNEIVNKIFKRNNKKKAVKKDFLEEDFSTELERNKPSKSNKVKDATPNSDATIPEEF